MQSELAGHIGLVAKAFCRACYVPTGKKDPKPDASPSEMDINDESDDEDEPDDRASVVSAGSHATVTLRRRIKENFGEMLNRVKRFMTVSAILCIWVETHTYLISRKERRVAGRILSKCLKMSFKQELVSEASLRRRV